MRSIDIMYNGGQARRTCGYSIELGTTGRISDTQWSLAHR